MLFDGTDFSHWSSHDGGPVEWKLVDEAMTKNRIIGLLVSKKSPAKSTEQSSAEPSEPKPAVVEETKKTDPEKDLYNVGTSAMILKMAKTEDNKAQLLVQGDHSQYRYHW